ncbi:hypothetical protein Pelo_12008 [Pelomyxa schiedti]|nr:hypothetical protein Pelo_12008 [Pelomyxa schiedti]
MKMFLWLRRVLTWRPRQHRWGREHNSRDKNIRPGGSVLSAGSGGGTGAEVSGVLSCVICLDKLCLREELAVPLGVCGHVQHHECMRGYIEHALKTRMLPITCPIAACRKVLSVPDLQIHMNQNQWDAYLDLTLAQFILKNRNHMYLCPTPNCKGATFFAEGEDSDACQKDKDKEPHRHIRGNNKASSSPICWRCSSCGQEYCTRCWCPSHNDGRTTCTSRRNAMFESASRRLRCTACPECGVRVERAGGCPHIKCAWCGCDFCHRCGEIMGQCACIKRPSAS